MEKIRYQVDPFNRIVASGGGEGNIPRFRKSIDGFFRIGEDGALSYDIKSPLSDNDLLPNQVKIKGEWSLTDTYDLRLTVDKACRETFGDRIILQGEILDVNADALLFAITTTTKDSVHSTYVLNLSGAWSADKNNRLTFNVKKEGGKADILTFDGAWEVNGDHQIIYNYKRFAGARKVKKVHTILFKGHWDIKDRFRITYVLEGNTESSFDFKVAAGAVDKKYIKYEVAIAVARRKSPEVRTISLSGRWNLRRDVGLVFEVRYGSGRLYDMVFGFEAAFTGRDTISFSLRGISHKDLGMELELKHDICSGDGEAFLRILRTGRECAIYAGAAWRW